MVEEGWVTAKEEADSAKGMEEGWVTAKEEADSAKGMEGEETG